MSSSSRAGWNSWRIRIEPPQRRNGIANETPAPVNASGTVTIARSSQVSASMAAAPAETPSMLAWVRTAPLARPVVPLV